VVFDANDLAYYYVDTAPGQSTYLMQHVPPGTYHVVPYTLAGGGFGAGLPGGYSQMVPCGLKHGRNDHGLIDVVVSSGTETSGVAPTDF
jgi:hypothetical protein